MSKFFLYTDGGCHGNPGPGAWAWRLVGDDREVIAESSGFSAHTTNNRMELTAVIEGLTYVRNRGESITVITDSQYVRQGITSWITKWRTNGWMTTAKKPVKNIELWRTLDEMNAAVGPTWQWVKGHNGDMHNEACDRLVQETIARGRT